jgi:hypothetical protein
VTRTDQPPVATVPENPSPLPLAPQPLSRESRREMIRDHAVFLGLACCALLMACLLQIDAQGRVVLGARDIPLPETCLYQRIVGRGCPGCGLTRCFISLVRGDWAAAWGYNPGGFIIFSLVVLQLPYRSVQVLRLLRRRPPLHFPAISFAACILMLVTLIGTYLLREFGGS